MFVGVVLAGFFGMLSGVDSVAMRNMRVMTSRFMVAFLVVRGGSLVVLGRFLMMLGGFLMVFRTLMWHANLPFNY